MKLKKRRSKAILSSLLAVLMVFSSVIPALTALAGDVIGYYDIELFFTDGNIIPDTADDGGQYNIFLEEGDSIQLTYEFVDCSLPNNGYIKWYSETPTLVSVDQNGLVRGHDSSKGAVIREWIDNDVATIPLVGKIMAPIFEKIFFNEYVDVDTMDTDGIISLVEEAFGSNSILAGLSDSYKGILIDKLKQKLDNINSNIHVAMYNADGEVLDDDLVHVAVQRADLTTKPWAEFIPNGTHITNKESLPSTVAVGSQVQLYACTTPIRLHMGVVYSVKSSSVFTNGKVIATVDDSGLVKFKNKGTVTIVCSPDTEGFINNLLKYINYLYELENTGVINTDQVAEILIKVLGLDMNRNALAALLDVCFAVADIAGDAADPVQLTATAVKIIANIILQFTTNDTVTFTVVDGVPLTDFKIGGATAVKEGTQIQLSIEDAKPEAAITSDITWVSSDPNIASVDPITGTITGRDAGGSLGELSSQTCEITATSAANNISQTVTITVTGKTGKYLSDAEIISDSDYYDIGSETQLSYKVFPNRVATADNLYIEWGIVTAGTSEEDYEYVWATDPYEETVVDEETGEETVISHDGTATDGVGRITKSGFYTAEDGGKSTVALRVKTGYWVTSERFYEISNVIATKEITNGQPVTGLSINEGGFVTKEIGIEQAYNAQSVTLSATVEPENVSNKTLKWSCDNNAFSVNPSSDTQSCTFKIKAGHEKAQSTVVTVTSEDGRVKAKAVVCVTRNRVTSNVIDQKPIEIINGQDFDVTHTPSFKGSWTGKAYACYDAVWSSSDDEVFTVSNKGNDNSDAVIHANDVGVATLTCYSTDAGVSDSVEVTVLPDKTYLKEIIYLCENTVILRTSENKELYRDWQKKFDYCYYILEEKMASQTVCDTYADELLAAFCRLGGYIPLKEVKILDSSSKVAPDYISVKVDTTNYTKTSYDLGSVLSPRDAMYSRIAWSSSNSSVTVDRYGVCTPSENSACYATITVTAEDYIGNTVTDSVNIAFAKIQTTGIELDTSNIVGGKVGETSTITATVLPKGTPGIGRSVEKVYWTSSDDSVATVNDSGVVTFVEGGNCIITATTADGGYSATCNVNVVTNFDALQAQITTYRSLNLSETNYFPDTWEYFQNTIAESQALVDAGTAGQKEVNAQLDKLIKSYEGLKKYNKIQKIEIYLDGEQASDFYQFDLSLLKEGISYKNAKLDLNVRLYPSEECNYQSVEWISEDPTVIAISDTGVASPAQNKSCYGKITCRVTDHFGDIWEDYVYVSYAYYPATGVRVSESEVAGSIGATHQLACTIDPTGASLPPHIGAASIQDVYWTSDDESIATVDQSGLVTFVSTGATKVRVTTYDGGYSAECLVSTNGDRNALTAAIEKYKDTDYRNYEYQYAIAFKNAYEKAIEVFNDKSMTQAQIDSATESLNAAGVALEEHPFIFATSVDVSYTDQNNKAIKGWTDVTSGTVSESTNAHSLECYSSAVRSDSRVKLTASYTPSDAMNGTLTWTVDSSSYMSTEISGDTIYLKPSSTLVNGLATVTAAATDDFGRVTQRTITVMVGTKPVTGVSLDKTETTVKATASAFALTATVSPSGANYKDVKWSSSNPAVATVDSSGNVTPVNTGDTVITVKTLDGGFTASCTVHIITDFAPLAAKASEYTQFINDTNNEVTKKYTKSSMAALQQAISDANEAVMANTATQAKANELLNAMNNAKASLVEYTGPSDVQIYETEGTYSDFYRYYSGTSVLSKTIKLNAYIAPENADYSNLTWTSDSETITVDENGLVTNTTKDAGYAKITLSVTDGFGDAYTDSVYVSFVRNRVVTVSFADEVVSGNPGDTVTVTAKVKSNSNYISPDITDIFYTSSDESIATVDQSGLVTFVSTGAATITATSYDGGVSGTVIAHTLGDMTALNAAIDKYADIVYTDYAYEQGMAFKNAYESAVNIKTDYNAGQDDIDAATAALIEAGENLSGHPFVGVTSLSMSNNDQAFEESAKVVVAADSSVTLMPIVNEGAMVSSYQWQIANEKNITLSAEGNNAVLVLTGTGGYADVTLTAVDDYSNETTFTCRIYLSTAFLESLTFEQDEYTVAHNAEPFTPVLVYNPSNAGIKDVVFSSSDESVASVDENGLVTVNDSGSTVITAVAADGGLTAQTTITVLCDKSALTEAYNSIIAENLSEDTYTDESFSALQAALNEAKAVIDDENATQSAIDSATANIVSARNSLVEYTAITGFSITDENGNENTHFTFVGTGATSSISGKTIQLGVKTVPEGAPYTVTYNSSNKGVSVNGNGLCSNTTATTKCSAITVTVTGGKGESFTETCYVTFTRNPVVSASFNNTNVVYGAPGTTAVLTPSVLNERGTSADVCECIFSSEDESIAKVLNPTALQNSATIQFVSNGWATIHAVTADGGYEATIQVYTTNDTSALKEAIARAKAMNSDDYLEPYYENMQAPLAAAEAVVADYEASQEVIDEAAANLVSAITDCENNRFTALTSIDISLNGTVLTDSYDISDLSEITLDAVFNDGAMLSSVEWSVSSAVGLSITPSGNSCAVTKSGTSPSGVVTVTATDLKGNTISKSVILKSGTIQITSFDFTYNNEVASGEITYSCGGVYTGKKVQLGVKAYPETADAYSSISWNSSNSKLPISPDGVISTSGLMTSSSYTTTVTCTLTLEDGSTVSNTINVTFTRS